MTQEEFKSFKRSLASPAVKFKNGNISAEELYESLYVVLGKETFEETEQLLKEAKKK